MKHCTRSLSGMLFGMLLALLFTSVAVAQNASVRGYVADAETGERLQGATIALQQPGAPLLGSATDGDGYFIINRVPPGTYTLRVSFIGYTTLEQPLTLAAGDVVQRRLELTPSPAEIDEVVVEAQAETGVTAVVAGLQTLDAAQIERVPMPGVTGDLASYLQTVPGIVAQGDRGGQLFVRGGSLDQNLALIDGLPIYMPFHILSFYSAFPEEIIDGTDLYTGGFGAQYGTRMSSVVDVRARNGNKQFFSGAASGAQFLSTLRVEGPLVPGRVSVLGSVRQSLIEDAAPELFGQRFPYRFGDRFGKVHALISASHSVSFTGLHTFDRGDLAGTKRRFDGSPDAGASSTPPDSAEVGWENTVYGGRYVYRSNFIPLVAELVAGRSEMQNDIGPQGTPERTSGIASTDAAAHLTYFLGGGHEIYLGGRWRRSELDLELGGQFQEIEILQNEIEEVTAYLETSFSLQNGAVSLQPGLNVYALPDRSDMWFEPRVRAVWQPDFLSRRHRFSAAWGLYHQTIVGLNDERDVGNIFTAWVPVLADAPVPQAMHAIVGWSGQVVPGVSLAAEGFYKDLSNLSVPVFSVFPSFTTDLQPADGHAEGLDLRLEVHDRPLSYDFTLDGYISYALSRVTYETETLSYHPSHDRRHQVHALVHASRGEISMTASWQYGSGLPFTASGGFDEWLFFTPDADVTETPGSVRVLYDEPFARRQPTYQRLDIWAERRVERGRLVGTLRAGVVNVFNRANLFYFDLFTLQRVNQLPLTPSLGFKLEVR